MSHLTTARPAVEAPTTGRTIARWMVSFAGFPLGGFAAMILIGPVDSVASALAGGLRHRRRARRRPGLGPPRRGPLARRLDRGHGPRARGRPRRRRGRSSSYGTGLGDLVVQGAVSGAAVGIAQAVLLRRRLGAARPGVAGVPRRRLGRSAGRSPRRSGIAVDEQFTVFGSSGAVVVALLTSCSRPLVLARTRGGPVMSRHVVFGTGQVGHPLVQRAGGARPRRRRRQPQRTRARSPAPVSSAATPPTRASTTEVSTGADVVYFCLNAMSYERWSEEFPPLQRGVLAGAASAGARLVVLDNLYAYGPPRGQRLVETMAARPDVRQGRHPRGHDRGAAGGPPGRPGRGRHRARVGLLRARRDPLGARRDGLRDRADRARPHR